MLEWVQKSLTERDAGSLRRSFPIFATTLGPFYRDGRKTNRTVSELFPDPQICASDNPHPVQLPLQFRM